MYKFGEDNSIINTILWVFRYICLPITVPLLVYKGMNCIHNRKTKASLKGKVVVITGASSGVGEALAHPFYSQGCRVVLAARRENELQRVKNDLLSKHGASSVYSPIILPLDLAAIQDLKIKVEKILQLCGKIDILINNGGISTRANVLETNIDVDIEVMNVNYFGPAALTKAVLPHMIENKIGHIVFVSSVQGRIAIPGRSSYAASKHAMQAFVDTLRAEVDQYGIKVSIISPGYINTALSMNALTATGAKYGVTDQSTASGYSAEFVADKILDLVVKDNKEMVLSTIGPKFAIFLRYFVPSLYFLIMARRASKM